MGNFWVEIAISDESGSRFETLKALVDTGATYTWVPRPTLEALGHSPEEDWEFELTDGRMANYGVKWIVVRINGNAHPTPVVFGEPGTGALLGAVTLEESRLGVDAVNERLIPTPGLLKRHR
jgi:predicted aspartyl protease